MRQCAWIMGMAIAAGFLAGCVERRFVVTSDPPGAFVLHNGAPIGQAPADNHFVYYGTHHFTIIKDGYATLQEDVCVRAPWYQYVPLDFVTEALVPWHIEDVRRFHFHLEPLPPANPGVLLQQGEALRREGRAIGPPPSPPPAAAVAPPGTAPLPGSATPAPGAATPPIAVNPPPGS